MFVKLAIIAYVVNAVEYTAQFKFIFSYYRVKSVCKIRVLYLLRITRTCCCKRFTSVYCTLHKAYAVSILYKILISTVNIDQISKQIERILSLIFYVMNCEKRPYKLVFFSETVISLKVYRCQRRLPVVAVHYIGIEIQKGHNFKNAS